MITRYFLVDVLFCSGLAFFYIGYDLFSWIDSCLLAAYTPVFVYSGQTIAGVYNDNAQYTLQLNSSINWV